MEPKVTKPLPAGPKPGAWKRTTWRNGQQQGAAEASGSQEYVL